MTPVKVLKLGVFYGILVGVVGWIVTKLFGSSIPNDIWVLFSVPAIIASELVVECKKLSVLKLFLLEIALMLILSVLGCFVLRLLCKDVLLRDLYVSSVTCVLSGLLMLMFSLVGRKAE